MSIKPGVRVLGVRPEIVLALAIVKDAYVTRDQGAQFVVTSIMEGTHKRASLHYMGCAADLRLPTQFAAEIVADAKARLGDDYDVILEGNHVHLEFQPKSPY